MSAKRVQMRRDRPWRGENPDAVIVDRRSRFGNPWSVDSARRAGFTGSDVELAELVVSLFGNAMQRRLPAVAAHLAAIESGELRGRDLACWCPPDRPCHADVLLDLANRPEAQ